MSDIAIKTEGLSKLYRLGELQREDALRNILGDYIRAPWKLLRREKKENFWALKNVDLEVKHGEVLGLIGRNGAGKTTLLKILSRITRPTSGWAEIYGRVGSLLEVGTGFHPELSGRDNVFLSGAILGMKKEEIRRKFDEIVAFAEIDKFLDTQVKHYSSGMYVRLAFAVAAHLDPEILLVDEVLAVGDIAFQKKCLGKMGDVAREGRTVILVSHNMAAINTLCSRCVVMEAGTIGFDGAAEKATSRFYADTVGIRTTSDLASIKHMGTGKARFKSVSVQPLDDEGLPIEVAFPGCDISIDVEIECRIDLAHANLTIIIWGVSGFRVVDTNTAQKGQFVDMRSGEVARANFLLREVLLKPGAYLVGLYLGRDQMEVFDYIEHATSFNVMEGEANSRHVIVFPGVYLCRFENSFSIQ